MVVIECYGRTIGTIPAVNPTQSFVGSAPVDGAASVESSLMAAIGGLTPSDGPSGCVLDAQQRSALFEAQIVSRLLDHAARALRSEGHGYYTIGSAGHESNAAVALACRPTDPALLHYRSGGFYVARAHQVPGSDPVEDIGAGFLALVSEPIAGGRHKVFGRRDLAVIPQTSTIASHLPRAVGVAFAIARAERLGLVTDWEPGSVVLCSFGDGSLNHSTAQGALNTASWVSHQGMKLPVVFVCEDNGIGLSVPTPASWVEASASARPGLAYRQTDGADPQGVYTAARDLIEQARTTGMPGFLHLRTVRFLGHAGSDVESAYRTPSVIRQDYDRDPILATAGLLVDNGDASGAELVERYGRQRARIYAKVSSMVGEPELDDPAQIMAPLAPHHPKRVSVEARRLASPPQSSASAGKTLAQAVNATLDRVLSVDETAFVFGEDVGRKGGVYGVTRGLQRKHGQLRVFDSLLDEQSILGIALGLGISGMMPIPEIQYLAYLHNAEDQVRGEAASLQFFSKRQFRNPLVMRIASYAYQRGFGGHFHNDNSVAVLRDIPGIVIASPSRPEDAAAQLRTCIAAASVDGAVCAFLEPIALYHTSDLYNKGDEAWLGTKEPDHVGVGEPRVYSPMPVSGKRRADLTIATWGNGLYLSLRAARRLAEHDGISAQIVDLRWLAPLPVEALMAHASDRILVVDETRKSAGVGEAVVAGLVDYGYDGQIARIAAEDSFVPLGSAAWKVLVSESDIGDAARRLVGTERRNL